MLSSVPFFLVLSSSTRNFEYHLFQMQFNFPFSLFFSRVSSMVLNFFTLVICFLKCPLTFSTHPWHFKCSIIFFPYVSPKLLNFFNEFFLTNFQYLGYLISPSFYLLKKVLQVSFKVNIIHYSIASVNEFLRSSIILFLSFSIQLSLYRFNIPVVAAAPSINLLSSSNSCCLFSCCATPFVEQLLS